MPAEGVKLSPHEMTADEIIRLSKIFHSLGVKKIKLTGGEPAVRPDIVPIC
jgi:molybdenum cofactor biosynthesis enzyme MoaA